MPKKSAMAAWRKSRNDIGPPIRLIKSSPNTCEHVHIFRPASNVLKFVRWCALCCRPRLPRPAFFDLEHEAPAKESTNDYQQSQNQDVCERWLQDDGADDVGGDENFQTKQQSAPDAVPEIIVCGSVRLSGDDFRQAFLKQLGATPSATSYAAGVEDTLDRLAAHFEAHLDVDGLLAIAR